MHNNKWALLTGSKRFRLRVDVAVGEISAIVSSIASSSSTNDIVRRLLIIHLLVLEQLCKYF